jgi:excisionase family DNA binding protein
MTTRLVDPADLMDPREAADLLGVTRQRVQQLVSRGQLCPVLRRERMTLLHRADVERYAESRDRRRAVPA